MTKEKLRSLGWKYFNYLWPPEDSGTYKFSLAGAPRRETKDSWEHTAWMAQELIKLVDEGRIEKAFRWLGWIQCFLYMMNEFTLDELKEHSMPEGEQFDGSKI